MRYIFTLVLLSSFLYSSGFNYGVSNKHAFVLLKNSFEIKADYLKVNDTIDVFNLKEKQFQHLGSIGDMNGYEMELRYGANRKDSLFANIQRWNVDYGDSVLKNNKYSIFNRYQIIASKHSFINAISFDVGFEQNSAKPIIVSSDKYLNSLIHKIKPSSTVKIEDGTIVSGDTTLTLYDKTGNKIYPSISIKNLKSNSYYGRLLLGKAISKHAMLDVYLGYKYIKISTAIDFYPKGGIIDNFTKGYNIPDMDRDEQNINAGFSCMIENSYVIYEFNYEYSKVFRDTQISYIDSNHVVDASIAVEFSPQLIGFIGGKLMINQFNTDIPYLYDRYTKTQFDHKYGFAKFGLVYRF